MHGNRTLVLTETAGQPDCLLLIINDETERFNAEEQFERTFAANPAPAIIARLADMRCESKTGQRTARTGSWCWYRPVSTRLEACRALAQ